MPIDDILLRGTEKDGSLSEDYCKYCYQNGEFVRPGITLDEMIERMLEMSEKEAVPADIVEESIRRLPGLKRWRRD